MLDHSPSTAAEGDLRRFPGVHRALLPSLLMVTLLTAMDQTIVATALPSIVGDIGGGNHLGWVFAGYTLAMTLVMPVAGRAGDLYGRRRLFLASIAAFVGLSALCGLASNLDMLVAFRVLQGLAAGFVTVLSQAVVADAVPARDRATFLAPIGLVFAGSSIGSPLLGGTLTDTVGWRWIFWLNLPVGLAAFVLAHRAVPRVRPEPGAGRIDTVGAVLFGLAVTGVVVCSSLLVTDGDARLDTAVVAATIVASAVFARRMVTAADPLIPLRVLRDRTVATCSLLGLVIGVAVFGLVGYLPTIVQAVLGLPSTASGALLLALVLGMMVSITGTSRWTARTGRYRRLPTIGCLVGAGALVLLARFDASWSVVPVAVAIALLGFGVGFFMQVVTIAAQDAVPAEHVGSATSTVTLVRELGVTVGAAAIGAALAAGSEGGAGSLDASVGAALPGVAHALVVVLLAGAAVSLALPDRRLARTTSS